MQLPKDLYSSLRPDTRGVFISNACLLAVAVPRSSILAAEK